MNSNSSINKVNKTNTIKIVILCATIILILVFTYIFVFTVKYLITTCYSKQPYFSYLFGFNFDNVCSQNYQSSTLNSFSNKEVFHVGNQTLTYEQAKCKCASYGARLATKNEMINAYNKGANWCTYGWCDGKNAYYPVQKCNWDELQKNPKLKNTCGNPGINGGYFENGSLKFGANCYGTKPVGSVITQKDAYCEEAAFCDRPENEASNKNSSDNIIAFNNKAWSQYST